MKAIKIISVIVLCLAATAANAVIPGYGLNYGTGNLYMYNEYNCSTHDSKDQFFLNYFEYGLVEWFDVQLQSVNYPDGSYHDLSLGGLIQFWRADYMNLRGGAMYNFGPNAPNAKADSICYNITGSGTIYGGLGYIYQMQCVHACHEPVETPNWFQQAYITYNITDDIVPYVSVTTELRKVDETTDISVGGWYTLLRDKFNIQWANFYFDVANLTEKYENIRISAGIDILF